MTRGELTSQGEQDTRLARLLHTLAIPEEGATYVEIGYNVEAGSNTVALRRRPGWSGELLDCCALPNAEINLQHAWVATDTIASLLRSHGVTPKLTYLSIDLDSFDMHVLDAILASDIQPAIITVEYNSNFPLDAPLAFPDPRLEPGHAYPIGWDGGCYMGSSATAIEAVARAHGYVVVDVEPGYDLFIVKASQWGARPIPRLDALGTHRPFNIMRAHRPWLATKAGQRKASAYLDWAVYKATNGSISERTSAARQAALGHLGRWAGAADLPCFATTAACAAPVYCPHLNSYLCPDEAGDRGRSRASAGDRGRSRSSSPCDAYPSSAELLMREGAAIIGPPLILPSAGPPVIIARKSQGSMP